MDWARPLIGLFVVADCITRSWLTVANSSTRTIAHSDHRSKKRDIVQLPRLLPEQTIEPSRTRDKGQKSGTVPEIPGQLEPMLPQYTSGQAIREPAKQRPND